MNSSANIPATRSRRGFWVKSTLIGVIAVGVLSACGHRGGGGWHHGDNTDPSARIEHMVDHVFSRVDATDEQKAKITSIASAAYKDLAPMRTEMKQARTQAVQLLTAQTIDDGAINTLRGEQSKKIDTAMTRATTALTDIAKVLTPEQRAQVREKITERMEKRRHGFWHRGRG